MATSATTIVASLYTVNNSTPSPGKRCKYTGQSVRALPLRILTVGKKRSPGVQLIVDDDLDKLRIYCPVEDLQLLSNPKNARGIMVQVNDEDVAVINLIRPDDWIVILDERGRDLKSEQMAELIGDAGNKGLTAMEED